MWVLTCLAALAATPPPPPSPDAVLRAAAYDLADLPAESQPFTRYLSLHAVPAKDRLAFVQALTFWVNSTSLRRTFVQPAAVAEGLLLRLDLRELEWDRASRAERLDRLEKAGVKFEFKTPADRERFLDVWEEFAGRDPYFRVSVVRDGKLDRGWLDPKVELAARQLSHSGKFLLRADWFLAEAAQDRPVGLYSDLLMLPAREADLYRVLGVDERLVKDNRINQGGALLTGNSIVALNNRELELLPSLFGFDQRFVWRTYDMVSDDGERDVTKNLAGTVRHDGREIIFSLPNGLHGYYAADGKGAQVNEVPTNIAQDRQDPYEARVLNAYKCVSCHGGNGINGVEDKIGKIALDPDVGLAVLSKDPARVGRLKREVEDYYFAGLRTQIDAQRKSYAARVPLASGLETGANAANFIRWFNGYRHGGVDLDRAAVEFGVPADRIKTFLKASGESQLLALVAGETISRPAFEKAFRPGQLGRVYPWETDHEPAAARPR